MVICMTGEEYQIFSLFTVSVCILGGLIIGWVTMYLRMQKRLETLQERIQILIGYRTAHEPGAKKNG